MEGYSQQLQFIHDCGLFIISFNFAYRNFNVSLKLYAVIKFWQNGKLPSWQISLDNLLFVATAVTCRGTSHPQAATYCVSIKMSRPHYSFEGIALVAT